MANLSSAGSNEPVKMCPVKMCRPSLFCIAREAATDKVQTATRTEQIRGITRPFNAFGFGLNEENIDVN
jgi:hypothetical protein